MEKPEASLKPNRPPSFPLSFPPFFSFSYFFFFFFFFFFNNSMPSFSRLYWNCQRLEHLKGWLKNPGKSIQAPTILKELTKESSETLNHWNDCKRASLCLTLPRRWLKILEINGNNCGVDWAQRCRIGAIGDGRWKLKEARNGRCKMSSLEK